MQFRPLQRGARPKLSGCRAARLRVLLYGEEKKVSAMRQLICLEPRKAETLSSSAIPDEEKRRPEMPFTGVFVSTEMAAAVSALRVRGWRPRSAGCRRAGAIVGTDLSPSNKVASGGNDEDGGVAWPGARVARVVQVWGSWQGRPGGLADGVAD